MPRGEEVSREKPPDFTIHTIKRDPRVVRSTRVFELEGTLYVRLPRIPGIGQSHAPVVIIADDEMVDVFYLSRRLWSEVRRELGREGGRTRHDVYVEFDRGCLFELIASRRGRVDAVGWLKRGA